MKTTSLKELLIHYSSFLLIFIVASFPKIYSQTNDVLQWEKECDDFGKCQWIINDDFSSNLNKWPLKTDPEKGTAEIVKNQGLILRTNKDLSLAQWIKIDISQTDDYTIESNLSFIKGLEEVGYGIIWGFKDWDNYQYFFINTLGNFTYGSKVDGILVVKNRWYYTSKINKEKKARNRLQVKKQEDKIFLVINGEIVDTYQAQRLSGKGVGIMLDKSSSEIIADNFAIRKSEGSRPSGPEITSDDQYRNFGSGFIISTVSDIVVTNYHVVENANNIVRIEVRLPDGLKEFDGTILMSDVANDLVLIKLAGANLSKYLGNIPFGISKTSVAVGSEVFTLGYPLSLALGKEVKFTDGKVSSKTGFQGDLCCYQVSVPVQPGSSGGPLFDENGSLVGIISSKISNAENIAYATKSIYLTNLLESVSEPIEIGTDDENSARIRTTDLVKTYSPFTVLIKAK